MKAIQKNSHRFPVLGLLLASVAFASAGCERMEPAPQVNVVLTATDSLRIGDHTYPEATLILSESVMGGLTFEIQRRDTAYDCPAGIAVPPSAEDAGKCKIRRPMISVGSGTFEEDSYRALMAGTQGPLVSNLKGSTLTVVQDCKLQKPIPQASMSGTAATHAVLGFEGVRGIEYNWGILKRGLSGDLTVTFLADDGSTVATFSGKTSIEPLSRRTRSAMGQLAVGTRVSGLVEGSYWLGGTLLGGGNPAVLDVNVINGAGSVMTAGQRQAFDFNRETDLTAEGDQGTVKITTQSAAYVELEDSYSAQVRVPHVDFNDPGESKPEKNGHGSGHLSYSLTLAIDPFRVLSTAHVKVDASFETNDGKKLDFNGDEPQYQTELDW